VNRLITDRLAREQRVREAESKKAAEDAELKRLADQQEFKQIADKHESRVKELEPTVQSLTAERDAYQAHILADIDANDKCTGLIAGEAIAAGDAVYIKSDGKVWRATGAAVAPAAVVRGFALIAAQVGEAVTFAWDVRLRYGAALTPGASYYLSGTVVGGLADAASTGKKPPATLRRRGSVHDG
jgi:beta-glucosidase-like glycosyl hydrolase